MFENKNFTVLMETLLKNVPDDMDKREGSVIWDALAPCAMSLCNMYGSLDEVIHESFADTASRPFLIKRGAERGLSPYKATFAVLKAVISPASCEIKTGERFSHKDLFFTVMEKISPGLYKIKAETPGESGNIPLGDLFPCDYINDFQHAEIESILIPAENDEDTEDFRQRYFDSFTHMAFGGNVWDYMEKVKKLDGVGSVKIIPHWQGGGTVKVIFLDSSFNSPNSELVNSVQTAIDPAVNRGLGYGIAPVGHVVTVTGAVSRSISISAEFTLEQGITFDSIKPQFEKALEDYFLNLRKGWESGKNITVRISAVEYALLSCKNILDIRNTAINGVKDNLTLETNEIPMRGELINAR